MARRPVEVADGTREALHRLAGREDDDGFRLLVRLIANGVLQPAADRDDTARAHDDAPDDATLVLEVKGFRGHDAAL